MQIRQLTYIIMTSPHYWHIMGLCYAQWVSYEMCTKGYY